MQIFAQQQKNERTVPVKSGHPVNPQDNEGLKEILDIKQISGLLDDFYLATGLSNFIVDLQGNILHRAGWKSICTAFHAEHETSKARCILCDTLPADQLKQKDKYSINHYHNGLADAAIPIMTEGLHVADLLIGPFFLEPPDLDLLMRQAEEGGFDKGECLKALEACHVYKKESISGTLDFLSGFFAMIGKSTQKKRRQKKQVADLVIANRELAFQNEEKEKRAAELVIANHELAFQNREKEKRAAELVIANRELAFQNEEKEKRAAELVIAGKELAFQNREKRKQAVRTEVLKEQNTELEIQKKLLAEASQHKSTFLSNMSHEIRTPINAIVGFTELALKTDLTPKQHNYLSKIKTSSHTLLSLVSDILDLSKIETGRLELEIAPFRLIELLQNVVSQVSIKCREKGLKLQVSIDKDVPVVLNGDSLRLGQVLLNLVSNAVKFTDEGEIAIRCELLAHDGITDLLRFSVRDTGIGLTGQQIENLFQPFTQADTSTTRKYGGTGLGLSISRKLVSLMDGDIWVESKIGAGSTFFFKIKVKAADKERSAYYTNSFEKWGIKALVADEQQESREMIGSMLGNMSVDATLCASGGEAIALLENAKEGNRFDIVIMNWKMPEMDGIETSKRIKKLFAAGKAPVIILMTEYRSEGLQEQAEQIGLPEAVLYKPVNPSLLFNTIIHVCGKDGLEQLSAKPEEKEPDEPLPALCGIRVLLVEDNEINLEVAQELLREAGLAVTVALNGREAVDHVKSGPYDIVLMDIQMPIMDGYDAAREIRKDPAFAKLPIIAMTANAQLSDQEKCIQAGMNDHVAKPIDTDQLFRKIAYWIRKGKAAIPGEAPPFVPSPGTSAGKAAQSSYGTMPGLAGIDMQAGLSRLGGDQKLYDRLLVKFINNHQHAAEEIRHAISGGDMKSAALIAHTIKGAAGNLGAQGAYLASCALEAQLKANKSESMELSIMAFEQAMQQAFASISLMGKNPEQADASASGGADISSLGPLLDKLGHLLHDNDLDAAECVGEIVSKAENTALEQKAKDMKNCIDQYDFEGASNVLDGMLSGMGRLPKDGK